MQKIIVDAQDQHLLSEHHWFVKSNGYVTAKINGRFILLHRLIMKAKDQEEIDHINQIKSDNRRGNLRFSDRVRNMHNVTYKKGVSGITGVNWHSQNKNWVARLRTKNGRKHLGSFQTKEAADEAYQNALQNKLLSL